MGTKAGVGMGTKAGVGCTLELWHKLEPGYRLRLRPRLGFRLAFRFMLIIAYTLGLRLKPGCMLKHRLTKQFRHMLRLWLGLGRTPMIRLAFGRTLGSIL